MGVSEGASRARGRASRPLRVLIVHDSLADNGGVRISIELADRFRSAGTGAELYAVQPVREGRPATVAAQVPVVRGVPVGGRLRKHGPGAAMRLLRACRRSDVVVSGSELGLGLLLGYAAARLARRPFAVIVHAPLDEALERWVPRRLRAPTRFVHRHADSAICVSDVVLKSVLANGLDPGRAQVVWNGIDVGRVRRLAAAGPPPGRSRPTFVALGRLSAEKGFDLLIRAHAEVRGAGVAHDLEIIGEGPERVSLLQLAEALGVADSVSLVGFQENPFPRVAGAAAFVLPSRLEGFSLSLLEALALGVPVIVTRTAHAAAELLGPDVGEVVDGDSVPALAGALRSHVESPTRLERRALGGVAIAEQHDLARVAGDYLRIFARLTRRAPSVGQPAPAILE